MDEIKDIFKTLKTKQLTDSERKFVESLRKQFREHKTLSDRQMKILFEINKFYKTDEKQTRCREEIKQ